MWTNAKPFLCDARDEEEKRSYSVGYLARTRFHNWHRVVKSFFRNYYTLYTDGDYNEFRRQMFGDN